MFRVSIRIAVLGAFATAIFAQTRTEVPRIWNETDLSDWATPLAQLDVRPAHFSPAEYYAVPADNFRTYPVYPPDREPAGYWEWLQQQKPEPLVDVNSIRTQGEWIAAGERAFRELDLVLSRTNDPALIAKARDPKSFEGVFTLPDGSVLDPRWVVTNQGLMLTTSDCASCHIRVQPDKTIAFAGPLGGWPEDMPPPRPSAFPASEFFGRLFSGLFLGEQLGIALWRTMQAPWDPDERVEQLRSVKDVAELSPLFAGNTGTVPRSNGSPFYGTKVPDLNVLRYSRYLEATGTHRLRGPEDVARYVAKIDSADPMDFGQHRMLTDAQRRVAYRYADEVLFSIGVYVLSLEPPKNPAPSLDEVIEQGERVFASQGCADCHTPPDYTSGKLTLAEGYQPLETHPNIDDILRLTVGTDPGLAIKTRKGTGFYKVPSLRGLWYRPYLMHDGSVASLEEMFDPDRLRSDHVPGGWKEPGLTNKAIPGHLFGMDLEPEEKEALIAFLRSL